MSAPRCETCLLWDRAHISPIDGMAYCLAKKLDSFDQDGARIILQSADSAVFLTTGPQFGCVHHRARSGRQE